MLSALGGGVLQRIKCEAETKDALKFLASWEVTKTNRQARILHMKGPCVIKDWELP